MTPVQKLLVLLVAVAIGFAGAWKVQDWRYAGKLAEQSGLHKDDLSVISNAAVAQARDETERRLALEQQLAGQDRQHIKELSDEQRKQAVIRGRLATTDLRLSVLLDATDPTSGCDVPSAPGAVGVAHATHRAQLDPAHAQRIIAITDTGDQGLIALRACQAYAKEVSTPK